MTINDLRINQPRGINGHQPGAYSERIPTPPAIDDFCALPPLNKADRRPGVQGVLIDGVFTDPAPTHFAFTGETKLTVDGVLLNRIAATMDIPQHNVRAGDIGGWAEKLSNLARVGSGYKRQYFSGEAWVADHAEVSGDAQVMYNAVVSGNTQVSGRSYIMDVATVSGNAVISGSSTIYDFASVSGNAVVQDSSVSGRGQVSGDAVIRESTVSDHAEVSGCAVVVGRPGARGNARMFGSDAPDVPFWAPKTAQ